MSPRFASLAKFVVPKATIAKVVEVEAECQNLRQRIDVLGTTGKKNAVAEQEADILTAFRDGQPLPVPLPSDPGLHDAVQLQMDTLKKELNRLVGSVAPDAVKTLSDFAETATAYVDTLQDAERETFDRLGLSYQPSALVATLRDAIAGVSGHAESLKKVTYFGHSPKRLFLGLVQ